MRNPNGYGGIIKLGGKRRKPYAARITVGFKENGQQIYKYVGTYKSQPEAIAALSDYNNSPYDIDKRKITFKKLYHLFYDDKFKGTSDDEKVSSKASYNQGLKHSKEIHDDIFIELRKRDLEDMIEGCGLGDSTKKSILKTYNQMYKFAMENDIIEKNYAQFVEFETEGRINERKPFTNDEIKALWNNLNHFEVIDATLIMIYTGLRIGELLALNKEDVNIEERFLTGGLKTDAGKNRVVPLNKKILPLLKKRKENNSKHLFANFYGDKMSYDAFRSRWKRDLKKLNITHDIHDCRHTFATLMDNAEANKVAVKRIMGHSIKDITEGVYTHKDLDQLIKAIDLI